MQFRESASELKSIVLAKFSRYDRDSRAEAAGAAVSIVGAKERGQHENDFQSVTPARIVVQWFVPVLVHGLVRRRVTDKRPTASGKPWNSGATGCPGGRLFSAARRRRFHSAGWSFGRCDPGQVGRTQQGPRTAGSASTGRLKGPRATSQDFTPPTRRGIGR